MKISSKLSQADPVIAPDATTVTLFDTLDIINFGEYASISPRMRTT
jgi:hypothetical protein